MNKKKEKGIAELWNAVPHLAEAQNKLMKLVREIKLYEDENQNHGDRDRIEELLWRLNEALEFSTMHIQDEDGAINQFRDTEFISIENRQIDTE